MILCIIQYVVWSQKICHGWKILRMRCRDISEPFDWHNINSGSVIPGTESFISTQFLYLGTTWALRSHQGRSPPCRWCSSPTPPPRPPPPCTGAPWTRPQPPPSRPPSSCSYTRHDTAHRCPSRLKCVVIYHWYFLKADTIQTFEFQKLLIWFWKKQQVSGDPSCHLQIAVIIWMWKGSNFCQNWVTYVEGRGCSYVSWCPPGCRGRRCPSPASAGPGRRGARCRTRRSPPSPSCS